MPGLSRKWCLKSRIRSPIFSSRELLRIVKKTRRLGRGAGEEGSRQGAAKNGGGVEIQAIGAKIGTAGHHRRVPVHDQPAVIAPARQEGFADPELILSILLVERGGGIDPRMHEIPPSVVERERQGCEPVDVAG